MSNKKGKEVVKKVKKKPGRKPKKKLYFGPEVQEAIIRYNQSEKPSEKNKIYQQEIHKAFDKLCENIINTFKFTYFDDGFEDVKAEVVSFLVMNMHKYDHTKGSKAFSYFSIVAKNYLILHNNNNYKRYKKTDKIDILNSKAVGQNNTKLYSELTEEIIEYFDDNIPNLFRTKRDINIAFSIIELMKQRDDIENFNKKAIYILIREMTNVETAHITKVINVFKREYKKLINTFSQYGTINHISNKTFF
jgi:hypothetical protein